MEMAAQLLENEGSGALREGTAPSSLEDLGIALVAGATPEAMARGGSGGASS